MNNRTPEISRLSPRLFVAVFAVGLALGACGEDGGDEGATSTETTVTTIEATTSTTTGTSTTETTETTTSEVETLAVDVFFSVGDGSDCGAVEAFPRSIPAGLDPVEAALSELVVGPTVDETAAGAGSLFSAATADVVTSVTLNGGLLLVDFADLPALIPNASTSCGSEALLAMLNSTVFQFSDVDRVRYLIDGSCDAFANWLQRECFDTNRNGAQLDIPIIERAAGAGCLSPGDTLRDGRWFGFISDHQADQVSFDLACWFTGTAAEAAANEDGEESPPPNDYYIRNETDQLRVVTVDPSAEVAWLSELGDPGSLTTVTYDMWRAGQPERSYRPGVWLTVENGSIMVIEEQFVP